MEHEEVADALELKVHQPIVFTPVGLLDCGMGEQLDQIENTALDQIDTGRFQRFEKPTRKPDRHAITAPQRAAASGGEAELARLCAGLSLEIGHQGLGRVRIVPESVAIDQAIAHAVLQRNPPLPPSSPRSRPRVRPIIAAIRTGHGEGPVAG